jgi:internalin A
MTDPRPPATKPPKRRKQFGLSLRVLMVLVLLLGGGMGWYAYRARVQREAVAAIEAAGGKVYYDWEWNGDQPAPPTAKPMWPKWLVDRVGPDYLGNVIAVCFDPSDSSKANDDVMGPISRLAYLQHLDFDYTVISTFNGERSRVTNAGLAQLKGLSRLKKLYLGGTEVTGAGLPHLIGMTSLKSLGLYGISLSDDDVRHLAAFTHLEKLDLEGARVTDPGLARIAGLTSLERLSLDCPLLTTAGLDCLRGMARLEELFITESQIDSLEPITRLLELKRLAVNLAPGHGGRGYWSKRQDIDIRGIERLKKLEDLSLERCNLEDKDFDFLPELVELKNLELRWTKISDHGLGGIAGLKKLKRLDLSGTHVSDSGLNHLSGLSELSSLNLSYTAISDAGLPHLYGLSKCLVINLTNARVSAVGRGELQQQLPSRSVLSNRVHGPRPHPELQR